MTSPATTSPDSRLDALIEAHRHTPGGLLPLLHAVQEALGFVPPDAVPAIAKAMNLSRAEVHGVISYYHFFRQSPPGRRVVQVCRAEACQACGAEGLLARASALLQCPSGQTRADGAVTLEPVYCLGLCATSPAIQIDDTLHARVSEAGLAVLLADVAPQMEPAA
jgi:formate dehydrogenase subunit gamma